MPRALSNGNIALVNGAVVWAIESSETRDPRERLLFAAGYPITPVNEVTEYLSRLSRDVHLTFIQAESEIAAGNMVLGAASAGVPALTVTSSPGMSLMQEAISYASGMELGGRGLVYVNVTRGGPGLGNIQGSQSDFNQAVLGGGHGDYQNLVLAPSSAQEMFDFVRLAFRLSSQYKIPGFILTDGYVGQLKEEYDIPDAVTAFPAAISRDVRTSIYVREGILEEHNWKLFRRFEALKKEPLLKEKAVTAYRLDDPAGKAEVVLLNYGFFSRIGCGIVDRARAQGLPVGQVSLKVLNPFPEETLKNLVKDYGALYVMEGGIHQLGERVQTVVGALPLVGAYQRPGGTLPEEKEVVEDLKFLVEKMRGSAFRERLREYTRLSFDAFPPRVNRGKRFERIRLTESTHDAEYAAGMDGKSPEGRKIESMTDKNTYYCAGCDHKHSTEALGAAFDAFKDFEVYLYSPVGCSIFLYDFFKKDRVHNVQVPHGRGPAAASATKRAKPHSLVISYQGDGDALDIGLGELVHASARGEKITVILMNNGTYGMTGGQLSATTPVDQFSKTTPKGRSSELFGFPLDVSQLLHPQGVSYYRRTLLGTPELNKQFSHFLAQAFLHQLKGDGMSVIEVIAACTEHQRAPQEIIEAFKAEGKKLHPITLSKEYTSKTMSKTFPMAVGWGEDIENPEEVLRNCRRAEAAETPGERFRHFVGILDSMSLLSKKEVSGSTIARGGSASQDSKDMRFYLAGEGGQGIQSLADVLMRAGRARYAFNSPWYEPEVTKARTVAAVTLSDNPCASPSPQAGEVDVLLCMTPQMYFEKRHLVRDGGLVMVDAQGFPSRGEPFDKLRTSPAEPSQNGDLRYQVVSIPAVHLATTQLKEKRSANMVMLGALNRLLGVFQDEPLEEAIRQTIPKAADSNVEAYRLGRDYKG